MAEGDLDFKKIIAELAFVPSSINAIRQPVSHSLAAAVSFLRSASFRLLCVLRLFMCSDRFPRFSLFCSAVRLFSVAWGGTLALFQGMYGGRSCAR